MWIRKSTLLSEMMQKSQKRKLRKQTSVTRRQFLFRQLISAVEPLATKSTQVEHRKCFGLHPTMIIEKHFGWTGHNDSNISHEKIYE